MTKLDADSTQSESKQGAPVPKAWVRRLVVTQGLSLTEKQLGWWTVHLESFLRYCCKMGERVEARILARGYYNGLAQSDSGAAKYRIEQTKQALTVFIRESKMGQL